MRALVRTLMLASALAVCAGAVVAATPAGAGPVTGTTQAPYHAQVEAFMERMARYEGADAIDDLLGQNDWIPTAALQPLRTVLEQHRTNLGEFRGYQLLDEYVVADRVAVVTMLARYDRQPIVVEFLFYRADKTWLINSLNLRTELTTEIQIAARERAAGVEASATARP